MTIRTSGHGRKIELEIGWVKMRGEKTAQEGHEHSENDRHRQMERASLEMYLKNTCRNSDTRETVEGNAGHKEHKQRERINTNERHPRDTGGKTKQIGRYEQ